MVGSHIIMAEIHFPCCPLVKDMCIYKEIVYEDVPNKADSLAKPTLDTVVALQTHFTEARSIWRDISRQTQNGLGINLPLWEQIIKMVSRDQFGRHGWVLPRTDHV